MKKMLCLLLTALAVSALTAPALADVIAGPPLPDAADLSAVLLLLAALVIVTLCISKRGGKRK